jgi:hypothetical protein
LQPFYGKVAIRPPYGNQISGIAVVWRGIIRGKSLYYIVVILTHVIVDGLTICMLHMTELKSKNDNTVEFVDPYIIFKEETLRRLGSMTCVRIL